MGDGKRGQQLTSLSVRARAWASRHPAGLFSGFIVALTLYVVVGRILCELPLGSDFKVYYGATRSLWHWPLSAAILGPETRNLGPVYGNPFWLSSGYFKYAPFTLLLMTPLAILPWPLAASCEGCLIGAALAWLIAGAVRLAAKACGSPPLGAALRIRWLLLFTVLVAVHRDIYLENINLLLAAAIITALLQVKRPWRAGACLGLALALKPYFALLLAAILLNGELTLVAASVISACALNLIPFIILPLAEAKELNSGWLAAMHEHVGAATFTAFPNLLARFLPIPTALSPNAVLAVAVALGFGGLCAAYLALRFFATSGATDQSTTAASPGELTWVFWLATLAILPNLVPVDDQQFLFATPLIAYTYVKINRIPQRRERRQWTALAVVLAVLFGGNMPDLIGTRLAAIWSQAGLIGLANLGYIGAALTLAARYRTADVRPTAGLVTVDHTVNGDVSGLVPRGVGAVHPVQDGAVR